MNVYAYGDVDGAQKTVIVDAASVERWKGRRGSKGNLHAMTTISLRLTRPRLAFLSLAMSSQHIINLAILNLAIPSLVILHLVQLHRMARTPCLGPPIFSAITTCLGLPIFSAIDTCLGLPIFSAIDRLAASSLIQPHMDRRGRPRNTMHPLLPPQLISQQATTRPHPLHHGAGWRVTNVARGVIVIAQGVMAIDPGGMAIAQGGMTIGLITGAMTDTTDTTDISKRREVARCGVEWSWLLRPRLAVQPLLPKWWRRNGCVF
ncbi:hypothetical protein F4819DRAFT_455503, partial [Hypoxylon fuscum]